MPGCKKKNFTVLHIVTGASFGATGRFACAVVPGAPAKGTPYSQTKCDMHIALMELLYQHCNNTRTHIHDMELNKNFQYVQFLLY